MANTPVSIGTTAIDAGSNLATQTITTTASVAAGDAILVAFNIYKAAVAFSSVTDGGDTFSAITVATVNNFFVGLGYCLSSAGLGSGGTISVTLASAPGAGYFTASAFKVVGGLLALDVSATAAQGATTALSAGPTGATAALIELVFAAFGSFTVGAGNPTFAAGGGYTALTAAAAVGGSDANALWPEYLVTAATGAQTATATLSVATPQSTGGIVAAFTYPAAADPFPVGYTQPFSTSVNPRLRMHHREFNHRRESGLWTAG